MIEHKYIAASRITMPPTTGSPMSTRQVSKPDTEDFMAMELAAAPRRVWAVLLRCAHNPAGAFARETPAMRWDVTCSDDEQSIVLTSTSGPLPDLVILCGVSGPANGPSTVTLRVDFEAGTVLQRWHRRRSIEQIGRALVTDVLDTIAEAAGNAAVRSSTRRTQRGTVQLEMAEQHWSGELVDISETGIAMSVLATTPAADREELDRWIGKQTQVQVRLARTRVDLPVSVAHVTRRRHDYLVGLQVLDGARLRDAMPNSNGNTGARSFPFPRKGAR